MKNSFKRIPIQIKIFTIQIVIFSSVISNNMLQAQSGGWEGRNEWVAGQGYLDYGNGVIRLLNDVNNGCEATAVYETSDKYNPCSGNFNKCYQVVFGCNDSGADGLAFTFGNCPSIPDYKVWGCGGGLGYVDGCSNNKGITIEFDTFNNGGVDDFDTGYEGTGSQDQIAIHRNMQAKTGTGKVTGVAVPNLEDGQEHTVCISYNNTSHVLSETIDVATVISYDLDLAGLEFQSYFFSGGCGGLDQIWSAGTNGGTNVQVVSNGANIYNNAGAVCPGMTPVDFLSVSATMDNEAVLIKWSTATETNNHQFVIERSQDLEKWTAIGDMAGGGNTLTIKHYSFLDNDAESGINYYRIKQIDYDGTFSYSKIVSVTSWKDQFRIMPNPFENVITIQSESMQKNLEVEILDVLGKTVFKSGSSILEGSIDIAPDLIPGTYILILRSENGVMQERIIKK